MSSSKKVTWKGTSRQVLIFLRPPPLLGFWQFCSFWIWSDTECKTHAEYGLQHDSTYPHPLPVTHCLFLLYFDNREGGRSNQREGERGKQGRVQITKLDGENTNMTEFKQEIGYLQSINSEKHLPQKVPLQVHLFRWRHFALTSMSLIFLRNSPSFLDYLVRMLQISSRIIISSSLYILICLLK